MIGVVYQLQFPHGKLYIGITTRFSRRMGEHRNGGRTEDGHAIKHAIRKYGWANVKVSVLEQGIDSKEVLNERERYWIKENGSMVHKWGYNLTEGGDAQPMDHPVVREWHKKQMKSAMNRVDVREKKSALWQDDQHKAMMQGARLNFKSAEKRRLGFARKREEKVRGMSVADGKQLMLKVRAKLGNNATSSRRRATPGQLEDAYAFWDREWTRYSQLYWGVSSKGFDIAEQWSLPQASSRSRPLPEEEGTMVSEEESSGDESRVQTAPSYSADAQHSLRLPKPAGDLRSEGEESESEAESEGWFLEDD